MSVRYHLQRPTDSVSTLWEARGMRTFEFVIRFRATDEVEVGKLTLEKFHALVKDVRESGVTVEHVYVREIKAGKHANKHTA